MLTVSPEVPVTLLIAVTENLHSLLWTFTPRSCLDFAFDFVSHPFIDLQTLPQPDTNMDQSESSIK